MSVILWNDKRDKGSSMSDLSRSGLIWWQLGLVSLQFKSQKSSTESRITSQKSLADNMVTKSKVSPAMDLLKQLHLSVGV